MAFATLKADFAALRAGKPGHRFHDHYRRKQRQRQQQSRWIAWLYVATGIALIAAGIVFSLVPGIPGVVLAVPGIGMLVARFERMARLLDRMEVGMRRLVERVRGQRNAATRRPHQLDRRPPSPRV